MRASSAYYDTIAHGYEELHREEQLAKLVLVKNWLAQHRPIQSTDLLLDVACGTGLTSDFPCHVVGLDPARQLLSKGTLPAWKVQGEAEYLPFADHAFNIVSSITALQNFYDPEQALREMRRVGKSDCVFILSFLKKAKRAEAFDRMIREIFHITEKLEEQKDVIYFGQ